MNPTISMTSSGETTSLFPNHPYCLTTIARMPTFKIIELFGINWASILPSYHLQLRSTRGQAPMLASSAMGTSPATTSAVSLRCTPSLRLRQRKKDIRGTNCPMSSVSRDDSHRDSLVGFEHITGIPVKRRVPTRKQKMKPDRLLAVECVSR